MYCTHEYTLANAEFALTIEPHNVALQERMKHIKTLNNQTLNNTVKKGGCGECQTSCQSACKTSCTVGNQTCEQKK
ncbi:MAG: six-cysteine ranthipeptide SCIFF [Lachnospiraceae bacterium]